MNQIIKGDQKKKKKIILKINNEKDKQSYIFSYLSSPRKDGSQIYIVFSFIKSKYINDWNIKGEAYSYLLTSDLEKIELNFYYQVKTLPKQEKEMIRQVILNGIENTHKLKEKVNINLLLLIQKGFLNNFI